MKKVILAFLLSATIACSDDDDSPQPDNTCNIDMTLFKDFTWHPPAGPFAELIFASSGIYYEDSTNDGNWAVSNGCDSIYITRPTTSFYYRILSVSSDTLRLRNPTLGDIIYHR